MEILHGVSHQEKMTYETTPSDVVEPFQPHPNLPRLACADFVWSGADVYQIKIVQNERLINVLGSNVLVNTCGNSLFTKYEVID